MTTLKASPASALPVRSAEAFDVTTLQLSFSPLLLSPASPPSTYTLILRAIPNKLTAQKSPTQSLFLREPNLIMTFLSSLTEGHHIPCPYQLVPEAVVYTFQEQPASLPSSEESSWCLSLLCHILLGTFRNYLTSLSQFPIYKLINEHWGSYPCSS